jgi:hypothetical protein
MKELLRQIILKCHKTFFKSHYLSLFKLIQPNFFGLKKIAFGRNGDGTYILPEELIKNEEKYILLSFGISNDISFEKQFHEKFPLIKIYAFDPTINQLPEHTNAIRFFKMGLAGKTNKGLNLYSLNDIFDKLELDREKTYIMKIDIEGWEWNFLSNFESYRLNIPIITIELHFLPLCSKSETVFLPFMFYKKLKIFRKVLEQFYLFHVHANNYQYVDFKEKVFPTYLEVSLINKELFQQDIHQEILLLNKPTDQYKIDIQYPFKKL